MSTSDSANPLNVTIIFEALEIKTEVGAALGVPPNASLVLDHLGVARENLKGVPFLGGVVFDYKTGEGITQHWSTPNAVENPGLFVHRSDLYEELKRLATGDGEGPPAKLCLGSKVLACDPEEGTITLNTGEVVQADLILGADGKNASLMFSSMCH
ncbi:hypothetical protein C8J57DRAFT_1569548 [Mycena rebaudengoi]|nr:hypothetical protein C8J57DRAFT_1569548 [Mycena rebaudengoi]